MHDEEPPGWSRGKVLLLLSVVDELNPHAPHQRVVAIEVCAEVPIKAGPSEHSAMDAESIAIVDFGNRHNMLLLKDL